jgi:uncharacterized protein YjbJ (UPF0337 family)
MDEAALCGRGSGDMKNLLWFLFGVIGGFVAAHLMNKDPRGHEVLAEVDARITEFTDRIGDAYREQEARISGLVGEVKDAAGDVADNAKNVASDAVDSAKSTASDAIDAAAAAAKKLTD